MQRQALSLTRKITVMGMMAAISIVLVYLVHFPIFPGAAFLEYDPADIPIFICTFLFGPVSGLVLTVATAGIQALTVSAQSGPYGFIMHVLATGSFALVAGNFWILIYFSVLLILYKVLTQLGYLPHIFAEKTDKEPGAGGAGGR